MKFENIVDDIKKLIGIQLRSIRPGANITLIEVSELEGRIKLITASKQHRSRPLSELKRIWSELSQREAVHVDSVLGGSSSSRNQPETILASLPYVEWLLIDGRKHLSFVGKATHPIGTLKQMDNLAAQNLRDAIRDVNPVVPSEIIVVEDTRLISSCLESITGLSATAIAPGIYRHIHGDRQIWIVNCVNLSGLVHKGVYLVLLSKNIPARATAIQIGGRVFHLIQRAGVNLLVYTD